MSDFDTQVRTLIRKVRDLAGEHCESFIFMGRMRDEEDDSMRTLSTWDGEFNEAVGLTTRMQERLRQDIIKTDFPDDPSGDEDWKEKG